VYLDVVQAHYSFKLVTIQYESFISSVQRKINIFILTIHDFIVCCIRPTQQTDKKKLRHCTKNEYNVVYIILAG